MKILTILRTVFVTALITIMLGSLITFLCRATPTQPTYRRTVHKPIPWEQVDRDIAAALRSAESNAQQLAATRLDQWAGELQGRIDSDFLPWYFGYWNQQAIGLRSLGYMALHACGWGAKAEDRICDEIQREFSARVLRPQTSQLQIELLAEETVGVFLSSLQRDLAGIPKQYDIPQGDWERHLADIALLTTAVEGNRQVSLGLKVLAGTGAAGAALATVKTAELLRPAITRVWTSTATSTAVKGAGVAGAGGARMAASVGSKALGAVVAVGVIAWDVWDHNRTQATQQPVLRNSLAEYVGQMKLGLFDGITQVIRDMQTSVASSMKAR